MARNDQKARKKRTPPARAEGWLEMLVCPGCRGRLDSAAEAFVCGACRLSYPVRDGIPHLVAEAAEPLPGEGGQP